MFLLGSPGDLKLEILLSQLPQCRDYRVHLHPRLCVYKLPGLRTGRVISANSQELTKSACV